MRHARRERRVLPHGLPWGCNPERQPAHAGAAPTSHEPHGELRTPHLGNNAAARCSPRRCNPGWPRAGGLDASWPTQLHPTTDSALPSTRQDASATLALVGPSTLGLREAMRCAGFRRRPHGADLRCVHAGRKWFSAKVVRRSAAEPELTMLPRRCVRESTRSLMIRRPSEGPALQRTHPSPPPGGDAPDDPRAAAHRSWRRGAGPARGGGDRHPCLEDLPWPSDSATGSHPRRLVPPCSTPGASHTSASSRRRLPSRDRIAERHDVDAKTQANRARLLIRAGASFLAPSDLANLHVQVERTTRRHKRRILAKRSNALRRRRERANVPHAKRDRGDAGQN